MSYSRFMRVTSKGVEVCPEYKNNENLQLIADFINFKQGLTEEEREMIADSFIQGGKPCPFCDKSLHLGRVSCIYCKRPFLKVEKV